MPPLVTNNRVPKTTALFLDAIKGVLICRSCTPGTRPEEEVQVLRGKTLTRTENQVRTSSSSSQPEALFVFRSIQTHQVPQARLSSTLQTTQFTRRGNPSCHRWITSPPGGGLRLHISTAYSTLQVKHRHTHKHLSPTVTNAMGVIFIVNYLPATDACRTAEDPRAGTLQSFAPIGIVSMMTVSRGPGVRKKTPGGPGPFRGACPRGSFAQ